MEEVIELLKSLGGANDKTKQVLKKEYEKAIMFIKEDTDRLKNSLSNDRGVSLFFLLSISQEIELMNNIKSIYKALFNEEIE